MEHSPIKSGFFALEILLSIALLSIIVLGIFTALISIQQQQSQLSNKTQSLIYAEDGIEILRGIRNDSFASLTEGTHGLARSPTSGSGWILNGNQDTPAAGFTRQVTITPVSTHVKNILVQVTDPKGAGTSMESRLTNWKRMFDQAANLTFLLDAEFAQSDGRGNSEIRGIQLTNNSQINAVIDKIRVSWTKDMRDIREIQIGGTDVWTRNGPGSPRGAQPTGTLLDIQDYTIPPQATVDLNYMKFSGNINNVDVTVEFIMLDESQTSFSFHSQQ